MLLTVVFMRISQFEKVLPAVALSFDQNSRKAFTETAFDKFFNEKRNQWQIDINRSPKQLLAFLVKKGLMVYSEIAPSITTSPEKTIKIYSWNTSDELTIISGLKNNSYFTHYTALWLHNLTEQIPKTIYLNHEHSPLTRTSKPNSPLSQNSIDTAFLKEQRKTDEQYNFHNYKISTVNGKYTGRLGVIDKNEESRSYSITDLPRTLIDIVIRPAYAGGVFEVLKAYRNAENLLNVEELVEYLHELDYTYPYHQAIGFYLERAGYGEKVLQRFENDIEFNFYLTYNMRNPVLDPRWKIYYPKGM
jgi:predicted transcriptional regulator of viral defense system